MFSTPHGKLGLVGRRNIDAALQALLSSNVALRSQEVGSYFARRVTVDCGTGAVTCERLAPEQR
jgi:chemotaxis receptor (MCP) glutamine deamidase CheD